MRAHTAVLTAHAPVQLNNIRRFRNVNGSVGTLDRESGRNRRLSEFPHLDVSQDLSFPFLQADGYANKTVQTKVNTICSICHSTQHSF